MYKFIWKFIPHHHHWSLWKRVDKYVEWTGELDWDLGSGQVRDCFTCGKRQFKQDKHD